jgi:mRNA interferase YafQ
MYKIETTHNFERNLKQCAKRGMDLKLLFDVVEILSEKGTLPTQYKQHKLKGKYKGLFECHIQDDWLLIWKKEKNRMVLIMTNTGTHAELFKK